MVLLVVVGEGAKGFFVSSPFPLPLTPSYQANLYPQVRGLRITLKKGGGSQANMVTY